MRLAQIPGMPAMPTADPAAAGGPTEPAFKIIYSPLDSLGKILADLDLKTFLENNFGTDSDVLAHKIWVMYGGSEDELEPGKKGERKDSPSSDDVTQQSEAQEEEYNRTRKSRWERLPEGVSIDEITDPQTIASTITSGFAMLAKTNSKPAQANSVEGLIRTADLAESNKDFRFADKIDYYLRCLLI
jgi:hypothetical protein